MLTKDVGHVEASADWLIWRVVIVADEGFVALMDEMTLMEMSVGGGFTA